MATLKNTIIDDTGYLKIPAGTTAQRPATPNEGMLRYNSTASSLEYYTTSRGWVSVSGLDGSSSASAAPSAQHIKTITGTTTSGIYWINVPNLGVSQVYCDMSTDGGGWMMLGYAGSTTGVGDSNHILFNTIGTLATNRVYGQLAFSRFDYARAWTGASSSSQVMWRRTNDSNVILIHSLDEMWNRLPGGSSAGNRDLNGSGSGYPISVMKMSNSGVNNIQTKSNGRYESGPSYPGIAWNSSYNDNRDGVGDINSFLVRRSLIYWETNGPQSNSQWFHADPMQLGASRGPVYGQGKLDIEVYFRL